MSNTGQRYLNGSQFTNITVIGDCVDDGSIQASGTLFVNTIKEYNTTDPGVNIENCYFEAGAAIITSTENSINKTTASLIVYGGASIIGNSNIYGTLRISNIINSTTTSNGSLIINGGLGLAQNLNVGGLITLFNTIPSYNKTSGSFITLGGISIQNTTNSLSFTSGGALTISGGASIEKTLFVNIINNNNSNILTANITTLNNTTANIISIISTNISSNDISSNSFYSNYLNSNFSNISNLNLIYGTFGNINVSSINTLNQIITNSTINNLITNNANVTTLISTYGNITSLTVGSLHVTNNFEYNDVVTNLSTSNIINDFSTISSLLLTNGTFSNLYGNNLQIVNITSTNLLSNNLSSNNVYINNQTVLNSIIDNQTIASLNVDNIHNQFSTISNLLNTNFTSSNISSSFITSNSLVLSDTAISFNSSTGTLISYGGISINITENSTSYTQGGSITIAGGASINKDLYVHNTIFTTNITSENLIANTSTISSLIGNNISFNKSQFYNLSLYGTNNSTNSSTGTLISYGGVSINSTEDATSITHGGSLTIAGGSSIAKSLFVGGIIHSSAISTNILTSLYSTLINLTNTNLLNTNLTNINLLTTNLTNTNFVNINSTITNLTNVHSTITNLYSENNTTNNIYTSNIYTTTLTSNSAILSNISYGTLTGNYIGSNIINNNIFTSLYSTIANLINSNTTITSLQLTNGTFGELYGSYIKVNNSTISSLISTNISSTNQTITSLLAENITVSNTIFTNNILTLNSSINNLISNNLTSNNLISNFNTLGSIITTNTTPNIFSGSLFINNTQNSSGYTDGGSLTLQGGLAVFKDVYVNGYTSLNSNLNLNNNIISNVTSPSNSLDVANKYYVDNKFNQFTIGNISGNFTQGQVIIAGTNGNVIGYSSLTFSTNGLLTLSNTENSTNLTTPGTLITYGGANILKTLFVGQGINANNQVISNVTSPSNLLDVTNKYYVDNKFNQFTIGNISGNFTQGQVIIAGINGNVIGYPSFTFNTSGLSILTTNNAINLTNGGALTVLGGASFSKNVYIGNGLDLNNNLITNVALPITPYDAVNKEYVDYYLGINNGDIRETNFLLVNNINIPTDITGFSFLNTSVSSFEAIVYLQIPELNIYDQFNIHGVLKGNKWVINTTFLGDYPNKVSFSITNSGQVQYINLNTLGTATLKFKASTTSQGLYTNITLGNIIRNVPGGGTGSDFFTQGTLLIGDGVNSIKTTTDLIYLNNTLFLNNTSNASSLTTASVIFSGGVSIQKTLLIGNGLDLNNNLITNVALPITPYDAVNKEYVDNTFSSGGSLSLYGQVSFYNTSDAASVTSGGTLTISGGTSIAKQLYVGGVSYYTNSTASSSRNTGSVIISGGLGVNGNINGTNAYLDNIISNTISTSNLIVNSINMTPSLGDIFKEMSFNASNNVNTPTSITGFILNNNVRYFTAWLSVFITATSNLVTAFTIEGLQFSSNVWDINYRFIGNNTKIKLYITNNGQIQYTCPEIPGFISSLMKFRSITTSVS